MEINWFTLIAQILNFFLLVWLLKRFLYKPILKAIDKRESNIIAELNDAEAKKTEALKEREEYKQKNLSFDLERKELFDQAIFESKELQAELLEKARDEAQDLKNHLEKLSKEKQQNRDNTLALKIQEEVFEVSRKVLSDLASASLEEQVTIIFIKKLESLKDQEVKEFRNALKTSEISLRSAFPLTEKQQNRIADQINNLLGANTNIRFEVSPELIGGIELSSRDYKLTWSISGYLTDLENRIFENLKEEKESDTIL